MGVLVQDLSGYVGNYAKIESLDGLKRLVDKLYNEDATISFDLETGYSGPDTPKLSLNVYDPRQFVVGFAITNSVQWARYIPLRHDFGSNLDPNVVWPIMQPLLQDKTLTMHNASFEARNMLALDRKGDGPVIRIPWENIHDTMIQSYVLSETRMHGLKPLTNDRFNYDQKHIETLFPKMTAKQKSSLRFNPLSVDSTDVVNYVCDDVTWGLRHDKYARPRVEAERANIYTIEREIIGILIDMAEVGISVDWDGISRGVADFETFYQILETDTKHKFEEQVGRDLTGINFRSTQQMQKLLFDPEEGLGLIPAQKTKKGAPSTGDTSLEAIRQQNPAVDQLLKFRSAKKMGDWFVDWSTRHTDYDEKIHPNFKQTTVQSGRFACDAPNVQNITKKWWFSVVERDMVMFPKGQQGDQDYEDYVKQHGKHGVDYWTGNARDYLIASPGYTLLSFDYSQQELRVLAGLAKEPYLIDAFEKGIDIHTATASLMFNIPVEKISKDSIERQKGKTINFGNVYGQGAKAMGDQLGISKEEAQGLFDRYFAAFSKVSAWFEKVKNEAKQKGYVESFLGRKSTLWDLQSPYEQIRNKGDRMAVNVPVQGGGADITKLAMIRTKRDMVKRGWWGTKVRLLMNQHDSLVFEVSDDLDLAEVKSIIQPLVSFPVPGFPPFVIDWEAGQRWGSCKKWNKDEDFVKKSITTAVEHPHPKVFDVKISFKNPTKSTASTIIQTLKKHPGKGCVTFVMNDQEKEVPLNVDVSDMLIAEIKSVSQGACEVERYYEGSSWN